MYMYLRIFLRTASRSDSSWMLLICLKAKILNTKTSKDAV